MDISISQQTLNLLYGIVGTGAALWLISAVKMKHGLRDKLMLLTVIVGAAIIVTPYLGIGAGALTTTIVSSGGQADVSQALLQAQAGQVSVTWYFEITNKANTTLTGKEYLPGNATVYDKATGVKLATVRIEGSAASGSWTGAQIGNSYVYKIESGDNTLNSFVGEKTIMQKTELTTVDVAQAGTLTFRVYDEGMVSRNLLYDSGDSETTTFEASGTIFTSVTNNGTATAIGTGSNFMATFEVKPTNSDNQFGDIELYLAIDAATTSWKPDDATITIGGVSATRVTTDVPRQLISDGYEELYLLPIKGISGGSPTKIYVSIPPKDGGTDPSADIKIGLVSKGRYLLGNVMYEGIVKADGSTYVHTIQTATVDVS